VPVMLYKQLIFLSVYLRTNRDGSLCTLIIAFLINPNMFIVYALVALIIGFVFYQQEVKKTV
jgi:hypothetical protein